jgi:HAD superfamily hydrolase (TIGR01509 family)
LSDADGGLMSALPTPQTLGLVIFDCDGVLVDSEPASRVVVFEEAARVGWALSEAEAQGFVGLRWSDLQPIFQHHSAASLPPDWPDQMQTRLLATLDGHLRAIGGAADLIRAVASMGLPYRIASNSSPEEMAEKFRLTGLTDLVAGRVHSAREVGRGKPAPDLFLAAAAAENVPPAACLVIEDSRPGVLAARAAGMTCLAYTPDGDQFGLAGLGAVPVTSLDQVPLLLRAALRGQAA